jgi:hypothetical protein
MGIEPFGTQSSSSSVPVQKLFGATVSKFSASTDFASQPGSATITLIEDETDGDRFTPPVVGSPVFFKVVDSVGATIFQYNGLLDTISRNSNSSVKIYQVTLISPLRILESVTLVLDGYAGYGRAVEGLPRYFSEDGYYQIGEDDKVPGYQPDGISTEPTKDYFLLSEMSFATNNENLNFTGMWDRLYNVLNIFGAYENESSVGGEPVGLTPYNGFGASNASAGMRVDKIAYAINELVNNTHSSSSRRYLGGNMLFGSNTYNVCGTSNGYVAPFPFYYGIDIIQFIRQAIYFLPEDFVINTKSMTIADFIGTICDTANCDFFVELHNSTYEGDILGDQIEQTYPNTLYGGVVSIQLVPRNTFVDCSRPFNEFTNSLLNLELPDMGSYGVNPEINPGVFGTDIFGNVGPLDSNYSSRGSRGSEPYGGKFPSETPADSNGLLTEILNRGEDIKVSLKATHGTTGKMVLGGYQTRMNVVPRDYIYQYWGDIKIVNKTNNGCQITSSSQKSIPVITQILPPNDTWDWIAIDMQDLFGNISITGALYKGIYFASLMEIRSALCGFTAWEEFIVTFKQFKQETLRAGLTQYVKSAGDDLNNRLNQIVTSVDGGSPKKWWLKNERNNFNEIERNVFDKVANIASTHYGKSWVAPVPIMQTKKSDANENIAGNFVRSWEISNSAYVEPYLYKTINAPRDSSFMEDGRLKAFVNFEHSFTIGSGSPEVSGAIGTNVGFDSTTQSLVGFIDGVKYSFDFSQYDSKSIVYDFDPDATGCSAIGMAHVSPDDMSEEYLWVPPAYFEFYNRGHCPFVDNINTTGALGKEVFGQYYMYTYTYGVKETQELTGEGVKMLESVTNDPNKKSYFVGGVAQSGLEFIGLDKEPWRFSPCASFFGDNSCEFYAPTGSPDAQYMLNAPSGKAFFSFRAAGIGLNDILEKIYDVAAGDYGFGVPFVKFSTKYVGYPQTLSSISPNPISDNYLQDLAFKAMRQLKSEIPESYRPGYSLAELVDSKTRWGEYCTESPAMAPHSVGIPQRSTRYLYGPWISNFSDIVYAGKFEYQQDENLVPEKFMMPVYGTTPVSWQVVNQDGEVVRVVENVKGTSLSGFAGMNLAGQAIANSIDNFSLFAQEQGSITIPGLPLVTQVGAYLLTDGPRITDISLEFDNAQVKTVYNFRSLTPRLGKENRELVTRLRRISNAINGTIT